jgi:sulfur-oxidizing protein SoxY
MPAVTRRSALRLVIGTAAFAASSPASSASADAAAEIEAFTGGQPIASGGIALDLAEMVEDGSSVPLSISVDAPSGGASVSELLVVADKNPWPRVAKFQFTPLSGHARVSTRIRLTESQTVTAVARTSDGRFLQAQRRVEVTVGACSN